MEPVTHRASAHSLGPSSAPASPRTPTASCCCPCERRPRGPGCTRRRQSPVCRSTRARPAKKTPNKSHTHTQPRALAIHARRAGLTQATYAEKSCGAGRRWAREDGRPDDDGRGPRATGAGGLSKTPAACGRTDTRSRSGGLSSRTRSLFFQRYLGSLGCHFTHRFAKFGTIALQNPSVPLVALSASLAIPVLEA